MKSFLLGVAGIFLHSITMGQGVKFEQHKSWKEVLTLAEKTGKHIFVDAFTTWCGPCIQMDREVFPQKEVGDFYNANFINFKIQMDQTDKDPDVVKARYSDAAWFEKTFNISAYPCYLFFDAKGNLIHQAGGRRTGADFVKLGQEAIDPNQQLVHMHRLYNEGNRSGTFVLAYLQKLASSNDPKLDTIANAFIEENSSPLSEEGVNIMMFMTTGSDSPYFMQLWAQRDRVFEIKGEERGMHYFSRVIDAGTAQHAMKVSIDKVTGKSKHSMNEEGLLQYFSRFYPAEEAKLQADFNVAKYGKLFDPQKSYLKAKAIIAQSGDKNLHATQVHQLGNMVLSDGRNPDDVRLVHDFIKRYASLDDFAMLQLFTKVHYFLGDLDTSYVFADRAMTNLKRNRPAYERVSVQEFVKSAIAVMPTPQIVTN